MQMFVWESEGLKQYSQGHIIVMAESVNQARGIADKHIHEWIRENRGWVHLDADQGDSEELDRLLDILQFMNV
jgi:hypothetical protein